MADPSIAAVVADARLTPDAVRLILDVAVRGDGEHEVSHTEFLILLNHQGGERRVRRALSLATDLGWLNRSPGGRGHSDRYEFRVPEFGGAILDRYPANSGSLSDSPTEFGGAKSDSPTEFGRAKETVVDRREVDREKIEEEPREPLSDEIEELASDERLAGCRDTLRDYLVRRVPPPRRYGFVNTILGWIDGIDASVFRLPTGGTLPVPDRPAALAAGMNELLAADERKMKRDPGDPGNLKTKINILMQQRGRNGNGAHTRSGPGTTRGEAKGSGIGAGQGQHVVE